jgi:hypothetical protein
MLKLITILKSLGFGSMLGSGLLGCWCISSPASFPPDTNLYFLIVLGALLGGGVQGAFVSVLSPLVQWFSYYFRITQLGALWRLGIITQKRRNELVDALTQSHFQPEKREKQADEPSSPENDGLQPGA